MYLCNRMYLSNDYESKVTLDEENMAGCGYAQDFFLKNVCACACERAMCLDRAVCYVCCVFIYIGLFLWYCFFYCAIHYDNNAR